MDQREKSCCFTGHRIEKLPWRNNENDPRCLDLKKRIADALRAAVDAGLTHFICGMATGCDMYFCEAALALREERPEVTVEAAVPWNGQADAWSDPLRRRHSRLVEDCDFLTLVQHEYTPDCLMRRNRYMVDNSRMIIAAYAGTPGDTMSTLLYAMRQALEIVELPI